MGAAQPAPHIPTTPLIQQPQRLHRALQTARRHPELDPMGDGGRARHGGVNSLSRIQREAQGMEAGPVSWPRCL